ncbi:hypothetical protein [Pantoea sp. aB]|uniref:hypothetical protein n=1 Tax=Pantoea sp. aB TaxID=517433 RepID=UPI0001E0B447|nr:hypothetical protein [Pantoea sp. aB]EFM17759.1 hypothetical protein PanABDRAFT_4270 [Pantoea sp. aB]
MLSSSDRHIEMQEEAAKKSWINIHAGKEIEEYSDEWEYWENQYYSRPDEEDYDDGDDYINDVLTEEYFSHQKNFDDSFTDDSFTDEEIEERFKFQDQQDRVAKYTKHRKPYKDFLAQMKELEELASGHNDQNSKILLKIRMSYTVGLMETCLGEMLRAAAFAKDDFKNNAAKNLKGVKDTKIEAQHIFNNQGREILEARIFNTLNSLLYHRILDVFHYYTAVFGSNKFGIPKADRANLFKAVNMRHAITHRNGKDKEGKELDIDKEIVEEYIKSISVFVECMFVFIEESLRKNDSFEPDDIE